MRAARPRYLLLRLSGILLRRACGLKVLLDVLVARGVAGMGQDADEGRQQVAVGFGGIAGPFGVEIARAGLNRGVVAEGGERADQSGAQLAGKLVLVCVAG